MSEHRKPILVTAASSYIGSHIVALLLSRNHHVRGTALDLSSTKLKPLQDLPNSQNLTLDHADVTKPENFPQLVSDCRAVIHVATPLYYPADGIPPFKTLDEAYEKQIKPAVEGTRALLDAASQAGVQTFVLTSSFAAMAASSNPANVIDEKSWSEEEYIRGDQLENPAGSYKLAKTIQEKLAWELAGKLKLHLVCINPVSVCGPTILGSLNSSLEILVTLANGKGAGPARCREGTIPNSCLMIVDVREVALAHVLAVEKADASGRYLLCSHAVHYRDVLRVLREHEAFAKLPALSVDNVPLREAHGFDNSRVRALGVEAIQWEDTIRESAKALANWGHV